MSTLPTDNPFLSLFYGSEKTTKKKDGHMTYDVGVITANLRKDMSEAAYKHAIRRVFAQHGARAIVGLQEVYLPMNTRVVHDFIVKEKGWAIFGMELECPIYWNPEVWKLLDGRVVAIPDTKKAHTSPTRPSTMARFARVKDHDMRVARGNCHMMNGVYTSNAPLAPYAWRKAAWHRHYDINLRLTEEYGKDMPLFWTGDCNRHDGTNPFGPKVDIRGTHRGSDYMGHTFHHQDYTVERLSTNTFADGSDHRGIEAHYRIGL